jgi:hypothetical protein
MICPFGGVRGVASNAVRTKNLSPSDLNATKKISLFVEVANFGIDGRQRAPPAR